LDNKVFDIIDARCNHQVSHSCKHYLMYQNKLTLAELESILILDGLQ